MGTYNEEKCFKLQNSPAGEQQAGGWPKPSGVGNCWQSQDSCSNCTTLEDSVRRRRARGRSRFKFVCL